MLGAELAALRLPHQPAFRWIRCLHRNEIPSEVANVRGSSFALPELRRWSCAKVPPTISVRGVKDGGGFCIAIYQSDGKHHERHAVLPLNHPGLGVVGHVGLVILISRAEEKMAISVHPPSTLVRRGCKNANLDNILDQLVVGFVIEGA